MKKLFLSLTIVSLLAIGCSPESDLENIEETVTVNLETFIPDPAFDQSPKGKYVGVFGHHTNPELHGKIFINAGQHNQYNALVNLLNGKQLQFKGKQISGNDTHIYFEGRYGSFQMDLSNINESIVSDVQLTTENTEGYIVVQKSTRGADPFVLTGTYVDGTDTNFTGNWDLIGTGVTVVLPVTVNVPGVPFPVTLMVPTQNIATLSISHSGSSTPILDNTFETNTAAPCFEAILPGFTIPTTPLFISADIPNPLGGVLGGRGSVSAGGQTSNFNGATASWNLTFATPILAAMFDGGFFNDDCTDGTGGSWSWNGRSGTISFSVDD